MKQVNMMTKAKSKKESIVEQLKRTGFSGFTTELGNKRTGGKVRYSAKSEKSVMKKLLNDGIIEEPIVRHARLSVGGGFSVFCAEYTLKLTDQGKTLIHQFYL